MNRTGIWTSIAIVVMLLASCGPRGDNGSGRPSARAQSGPDGAAEQPLAVEAMEVSRGSLLQMIQASGTVRGIREVGVVSQVEGPIERSTVELGQTVEQGQLLLQVESTVARLNVEEAREALDSARLDLAATQRRFEAGSASQAELTRARSAANGAQARFEAARESLADHSITAPISGRIAGRNRNIGAGNYLTRGLTVARIVDLSSLEMEVSVGERELSVIEEGGPAEVGIPACGDAVYQGQVASIAAGADPSTGSFPLVVRWTNECESVRSGMNAVVRIRPAGADLSLIVPSAAVRNDADGRYVYVSVDGTAQRRTIQVGERLGERVRVTGGLSEGDVIITSALSAMSDGRAVEATVRGRTGELL